MSEPATPQPPAAVETAAASDISARRREAAAPSGADAVRAMIEGAEPAPAAAAAPPPGKKPRRKRADGPQPYVGTHDGAAAADATGHAAPAGDASAPDARGRGARRHPLTGGPAAKLPDDCPVVPLGIAGEVYYYMDQSRQLRALEVRGHHRLGLQSLFGTEIHRLYDYWPRHNKDGNVSGWRPELAAERLMTAAAAKGVLNVFDRIRGRGAWLGEAGELILHCGDGIWQGPPPAARKIAFGGWLPPGAIGRHIYPAAPPMARPTDAPAVAGPGGPAAELLSLLVTWAWRRGEIDAVLLLGWIGAALIGGALKWRPVVWLTGGRGTGKSTLHELLKLVFDDAMISVSDASAAGIWQKLKHDTLPVALDELEAEEDSRKAQMVIKLARQAASGGLVLRGGQDHTGAEFVARSCFLFSSILVPPLMGQDRSRLAILELGELAGKTSPVIDHAKIRALGGALRRRLCDNFDRFPAVLERYRRALADVGHSARGADQFGTLLAAADVLLYDPPIADRRAAGRDPAEVAKRLEAGALSEWTDDVKGEDLCRQHLLTTAVDPYRHGTRRTIGDWIEQAAGTFTDRNDPHEANKALQTFGLKVLKPKDQAQESVVAIAHYHTGLAQLFKDTHWQGRAGTMGVWVQEFRRLPGADRPAKSVRFGAVVAKATIVPLAAMLHVPKGGVDAVDRDASDDRPRDGEMFGAEWGFDGPETMQ